MGRGLLNPRLASAGLAGLFALVLLLVAHSQSPPAIAQGQVDPPPGDCWGGALSGEALQCYVLEEAQRAGLIEVDGLFVTPTNVLHIYLSHPVSGPLGDTIVTFFHDKTREFVNLWPHRVYYDYPFYQGCAHGDEFGRPHHTIRPYAASDAAIKAKYRDCFLDWVPNALLPFPRTFARIRLYTGGVEARKTEGGWASNRQLWPPAGATGTSGAFSVSGVDTTNIPEIDCNAGIVRYGGGACDISLRFPGLGMAGSRSGRDNFWVQVKASSGQDPRVAAAREAILDYYPGVTEESLVIHPVKHSFEEYWRWATILNRFAFSSGNTLGITTAEIATNLGSELDGDVYPVPEVRPVSEFYLDAEDFRTTINLWTLNLQTTVDALPELLRQLGIPVDAVGVVMPIRNPPSGFPYPEVGGDASAAGEGDAPVFGSTEETARWLAVVGIPLAVVAVVVIVFAGVRMALRSS